MRILFLNSIFPGQFRALARAYGAAGHTVLFLAESGQKATVLPGVRRLRLAPPRPYESSDAAEREGVRLLRRGARAGNAMLGLRRNGFAPDLVFVSAGMGGSFYVRDIFPKAYVVCFGDWFCTRELHGFFARGNARATADFAPARVRNLWEYNALGDCDLAVTSSLWQRAQYPPLLRDGIRVVHAGVNTRYFSPGESGGNIDGTARELVTFCASPHDPARGFAQFRQCLPRLLERRPRCLVVLTWPEGSRAGGGRAPTEHAGEAWEALGLPDMEAPLRTRVRLLGACLPDDYRSALRHSTAHVYLAAPHVFSTGLLEAMSCGVPVVASDTPPVREVVRDGVNGFLCDFWDSAKLADMLADVLERAPQLERVRREARRTVLEDYEAETQTARLMALVAEGMERMRDSRKQDSHGF